MSNKVQGEGSGCRDEVKLEPAKGPGASVAFGGLEGVPQVQVQKILGFWGGGGGGEAGAREAVR